MSDYLFSFVLFRCTPHRSISRQITGIGREHKFPPPPPQRYRALFLNFAVDHLLCWIYNVDSTYVVCTKQFFFSHATSPSSNQLGTLNPVIVDILIQDHISTVNYRITPTHCKILDISVLLKMQTVKPPPHLQNSLTVWTCSTLRSPNYKPTLFRKLLVSQFQIILSATWFLWY
jgi:hypothetical protein